MKGLLTKDIHLLLRQKKTILLMGLILLLLSHNGLNFTLGYFIFVCFLLGDVTVGLDIADKNLTYLMTLPVVRKMYVLEKYLLMLLPGFAGTLLAIAIRFGMAWIQKQPVVWMDFIIGCLCVFLVCSLMVAVLLPIELLGTEKSKIVINVLAGAFGVVWIMLMQNEEALQKIINYTMKVVENISVTGAFTGALGIWTVVMASSIGCSTLIMNKKEF